MKAKEIMTPHPEAVTSSDPVQRAAEIMRDSDVGFVPIVKDQSSMQLEGVITDRDIAIRHVAAGHPQACQVRDHMTTDGISTVDPEAPLERVLEAMKGAQVRRIPVVEKDGRLVGVIAQADIAMKESGARPEAVAKTVERISEPGPPQR